MERSVLYLCWRDRMEGNEPGRGAEPRETETAQHELRA